MPGLCMARLKCRLGWARHGWAKCGLGWAWHGWASPGMPTPVQKNLQPHNQDFNYRKNYAKKNRPFYRVLVKTKVYIG